MVKLFLPIQHKLTINLPFIPKKLMFQGL